MPEHVQYVQGTEFVKDQPERLLCKLAGNSLPHVIDSGHHVDREGELLEELYESIRDPNTIPSETYNRLYRLATDPLGLATHIRLNLPFRYLEYWVFANL